MKLRNKRTGDIWEDVGGTNDTNIPIIKDEKIRKAVRAWAEANDYPKTMELYYNAPNFVLRSDISTIEFDKEIEPLQHGEQHTIAELCGEEELRPVIVSDIKYEFYDDYLKRRKKK